MATSTASGHLRLAVMAVFIMSLLVITPQMAHGAISCGTVTSSLSNCIPFLTNKVPSPPATCCNGVRRLNSLASSTADRRAVCNCLKQLLSRTSSINLARARGLPGRCGVRVPYPISPSTNCNSVN